MSIPPNSWMVFSTAFWTDSSLLISHSIGSPLPPALLISSAAVKIVPGSLGFGVTGLIVLIFNRISSLSDVDSPVLAAIAMFAPSRAKAKAIPRPYDRSVESITNGRLLWRLWTYNASRCPTNEYIFAFETGVQRRHEWLPVQIICSSCYSSEQQDDFKSSRLGPAGIPIMCPTLIDRMYWIRTMEMFK